MIDIQSGIGLKLQKQGKGTGNGTILGLVEWIRHLESSLGRGTPRHRSGQPRRIFCQPPRPGTWPPSAGSLEPPSSPHRTGNDSQALSSY